MGDTPEETRQILDYWRYTVDRPVEAGLIKQRLDMANARADVPIKASCFCRLEHAHG